MLEDVIADNGLIETEVLNELYDEAMDLSTNIVEYLQRDKRENIKNLDVEVMSYYTLECNRMTAGVMQAISWCLMQKGVRSGELTTEEAAKKVNRLSNNELFSVSVGCDLASFPEKFSGYSSRTRELYDRIVRIDRLLYEGGVLSENPVHNMMDKIEKS